MVKEWINKNRRGIRMFIEVIIIFIFIYIYYKGWVTERQIIIMIIWIFIYLIYCGIWGIIIKYFDKFSGLKNEEKYKKEWKEMERKLGGRNNLIKIRNILIWWHKRSNPYFFLMYKYRMEIWRGWRWFNWKFYEYEKFRIMVYEIWVFIEETIMKIMNIFYGLLERRQRWDWRQVIIIRVQGTIIAIMITIKIIEWWPGIIYYLILLFLVIVIFSEYIPIWIKNKIFKWDYGVFLGLMKKRWKANMIGYVAYYLIERDPYQFENSKWTKVMGGRYEDIDFELFHYFFTRGDRGYFLKEVKNKPSLIVYCLLSSEIGWTRYIYLMVANKEGFFIKEEDKKRYEKYEKKTKRILKEIFFNLREIEDYFKIKLDFSLQFRSLYLDWDEFEKLEKYWKLNEKEDNKYEKGYEKIKKNLKLSNSYLYKREQRYLVDEVYYEMSNYLLNLYKNDEKKNEILNEYLKAKEENNDLKDIEEEFREYLEKFMKEEIGGWEEERIKK